MCSASFPFCPSAASRLAAPFPAASSRCLPSGRALSGPVPKLLLLDEPLPSASAPIIIQQYFSIIQKVNSNGTTVFLVEQNANQALRIANHGYVMENGRIVMHDTAANLLTSEEVRTAYLGM